MTGDIQGDSEDEVIRRVMKRRELAGAGGPTISAVHTGNNRSWFTVQVLVQKTDLTEVVNHFRDLGGIGIASTDVQYAYRERCDSYDQLLANLSRFRETGN